MWSFIPAKCLRDLICDPLRDRMRCCVDPDKIFARQPDDDESVEQLKSDARNRQQVHGGDWRRVVAKEPSLRSGRGSLRHVLRHARLSDFETGFSNSPWIRGAPHSGLSTLICRITRADPADHPSIETANANNVEERHGATAIDEANARPYLAIQHDQLMSLRWQIIPLGANRDEVFGTYRTESQSCTPTLQR
jgi:hypothetical protein